MTQFDWTDEAEAKLRELWDAGKTCRQIADAFDCAITRNAVIGKAHRLGLPRRQEARRYDRPAALIISIPGKHVAPRRALMPVIKTRPLPPVEPTVTGNEPTLMGLTRSMCKFPIGDDTGAAQRFCAAPVPDDAGRPYCPYHRKLTAQPIDPRARSVAHKMGNGNGRAFR